MIAYPDSAKLKGPLGMSLALHAALVIIVLLSFRKGKEEPLPPIYRVNIVAAPPGPRAIGVVQPPTAAPKPATPAVTPPAPPKTKEPAVPIAKATPQKATPRATPVEKPAAETPPANAPKAGGGPIGGKGTDVATVQTEGIDFPFPGYLNNIVRQIALRFNPADANSGRRAEVRFVIRRDGSVIGIGFVTRSGSYAFDLEAQGSIDAAASQFGPLPEGFHDDALPVVFSFDPRIIR
ncbi:MAG TPA: TonB C-terminal domain-containing protein [Gemmatimonadaceae bacterium]|nr:TonB C-terminal domain-containing protein [Gemmatimonadaceae bacterium]